MKTGKGARKVKSDRVDDLARRVGDLTRRLDFVEKRLDAAEPKLASAHVHETAAPPNSAQPPAAPKFVPCGSCLACKTSGNTACERQPRAQDHEEKK